MKNADPLLILRAISCIVIVWRHSYPGLSIWNGSNDITHLFIPNTSAAVLLFYFLSAYGIGYGFATGKYGFSLSNLLKFYKNRIIRIAPLYYFLLLITPFIFYNSYPLNSNDIVRLSTFTATNTRELSAYRIWGMLSTEMQFYLVAPLLYFFVSKTLIRLPLAISLGLSIIVGTLVRLFLLTQGISNDSEYIAIVFTTVLGNIDTFLIGIIISSYLAKRYFIVQTKTKILLTLVLIAVLIPWYNWSSHLQYTIGWDNWFRPWRDRMMFLLPPTTSLLASGLTLVLAKKVSNPPYMQKPLLLVKNLAWLPSTFPAIGVLSYGIFLWHAPIADAVYNSIGTPFGTIPTLYRFSIVFFLALLCSLGTYLFIEVPFLKFASHGKPQHRSEVNNPSA